MARPGKKKKALFILEIVVLLVFIGGLYVYGQIMSRLNKIETPTLEADRVEVNPDISDKLTGYSTYALFGIDHRDKNATLEGENSDTMIIASINNDTKDVKLVSVYRDTLLNIGSDTYSKANAAYAYGGPEQAISMLNTNLDLNITGYATVDFNALTAVIDALGGLDIPMSYAEIEHMNNYCVETSEETGKDYTPIEKPVPAPEDQEAIIDTYHLNGVQATSYCRIRYTASLDMGRTERQRRVIQMIVDKAKKAGLTTIFNIMDEVFPMVKTSIPKSEILKLIPAMIGYSIDDTTGFPSNFKFSNIKGSIIVPTDLESNVVELHKFLYGDAAYTPSNVVSERSAKILEIVSGGELEEAPSVTTETDTADDSFVWQDPNAGGSSSADQSGNSDYTPDYSGGGSDGGSSGGGDYTPPDNGSGGDGGGDYTPPDDGSGGGGDGGGDYTPPDDGSGGGGDGGGDYTPPDDGSGGGGDGGGDYTPPDDGSGGEVDDGSGDGGNMEAPDDGEVIPVPETEE